MNWIVLKQVAGHLKQPGHGSHYVYGPILASTAELAISSLASGATPYVPTRHGRYHAIPLHVWQEGTRDYTKSRGCERIDFGGSQE